MERTVEVLTPAEVSALLAARQLLAKIEHRVSLAAYDAGGGRTSHGLGRLAETLSHASDSLFDVLNVASSYADCGVAKDALHAGRAR